MSTRWLLWTGSTSISHPASFLAGWVPNGAGKTGPLSKLSTEDRQLDCRLVTSDPPQAREVMLSRPAVRLLEGSGACTNADTEVLVVRARTPALDHLVARLMPGHYIADGDGPQGVNGYFTLHTPTAEAPNPLWQFDGVVDLLSPHRKVRLCK